MRIKVKKVGIVTYHCVDNYGAVLQAYSLLNTISLLSKYDVEIVDYRPNEITKNYSFSILPESKSLVKFVSNLLSYPFKKNKNKKFLEFSNKHFRLSNKVSSSSWRNYDFLIVGSDQVWNPAITRLEPYYLNFTDIKAKKISYAASIGKDELSADEVSYLSNSIKFVDTISVREDSAVTIIESFFPEKNVTQVLDPVFLKEPSNWLNILPNRKRFSNYILIYIMEYNKDLFSLANKLAEQENKKIIVVSPNANIKTILKSLRLPGKVLYTEGPIDFLELIVNADYICTNSFHGTAFSIIFRKKFITVPHGTRNTRLESILTKLGLLSQQLEPKEMGTLNNKNVANLFDYDTETASARLDILKEKSLKFLKEALK